jgi:hypothetical protein
LHSKNIDAPIARKELFPDNEMAISNVCGDSDGLSVVRNIDLADGEILKRSAIQSAVRQNRTPRGASVASVFALRNIRTVDNPDKQVVFVYDDPKTDDPYHAVVRGEQCLDNPDRLYVRNLVLEQFHHTIHSP